MHSTLYEFSSFFKPDRVYRKVRIVSKSRDTLIFLILHRQSSPRDSSRPVAGSKTGFARGDQTAVSGSYFNRSAGNRADALRRHVQGMLTVMCGRYQRSRFDFLPASY